MRFFRRSPQVQEAAETSEELAEARERTEQALQRTRRGWFGHIAGLFERGSVGDELWEELEELLIGADVGVATTRKILDQVREQVERERVREPAQVQALLKETLVGILAAPQSKGRLWGADGAGAQPPRPALSEAEGPALSEACPERSRRAEGPAVILVLGVNGTGKTTTIAKLAHAYRAEGEKAVIAAADTFRAAAIEQLKEWGERVDTDVIAHKQGADPGAVVFDALAAAESRGADAVIIDTAGRLHTKFNLMEELAKIRRVIQRKEPSAPHEVLLVLDATTGQNALIQARAFTEAVEVTSICLTKLDGTSKGGIVFAICDQLGIPVSLVGTGERPEDLAPFSAEAFVDALFR